MQTPLTDNVRGVFRCHTIERNTPLITADSLDLCEKVNILKYYQECNKASSINIGHCPKSQQ